MDIFEKKQRVKICAPMVRYSKLPFRILVRKYGCDLAYTPMILADSFVKSQRARDNEFTTTDGDRPLIVQFAANNPQDFADAAELVAPVCDGVDLNCGCPQRWAQQEGLGCCLMKNANLVKDIILQTRNRIARNNFSISVKIRLHHDIRQTVSFCQQLESSGVSFIAIHGRTKEQRNEPVDYDSIRTVTQSLHIPVVANGDIRSLGDVKKVQEETGVSGVMAARGILQNPAMFAGYDITPVECVRDWVQVALETGTLFSCFHHHLIYMCERSMSRAERRVFNVLTSTASVLDYLQDRFFLDND